MATKKYLHFRSPYLYSTFNKTHDLIIGTNGVLFGMGITDAGGGDIYIGKGAFIVNGLMIELDEDVLFTPTSGIFPLYLLASTASVHAEDPVVWSVTSELSEISDNSALIASYNGSEWVSVEKLSLNEVVKAGHEHNRFVSGKGVYSGYVATLNDSFTQIDLTPGYLIDGVGTTYRTEEDVVFSVGDLDIDFPRRDVIVYRKPVDDWKKPGILEKVVGPTYSLTNFSDFENVRENQVSTTAPSAIHEKPQCVVDSENNLFVFWLSSNSLYFAKWNSARDTELIGETLVDAGFEDYQVLMDQNDKIHITGIISNNVVYKRITNSGTTEVLTGVVDNEPNDVSNPSLAVDNLGYIYIMYSHVEQVSGIPSFNRQIYFVKLNSNGTKAINPLKLTNDTNDYTSVKIDIDENRVLFFVAKNENNERIYLGTANNEGVILTSPEDIADDTGGNFGTGEYTAIGTTACYTPVLMLSDIGDVYVAWTQERIHPSFTAKSLVLYHPRFKEVNGFKALVLGMENQNLGFGEYGYGVRGYGRDLVDRAGRILEDEDVSNPSIAIDGYRNVILSVDARLDPTDAYSIWAVKMVNNTFNHQRRLTQIGPFKIKHTFTYADEFENASIVVDQTGSLAAAWVNKATEDIFFNKSTAAVFIEGFVESDIELWLSEISYPANTIATLGDVTVTNRNKNNLIDRVKKVTVGVNETSGDFVGDHGIKEALEFLKNFGGVVEIQGGTYSVGNSYEIFSGIKVRTLGKVYFEKKGGIGPIFTMTGKKASLDSKTTTYFTDLDVDFRAQGFLIGDVVDMLDAADNHLQRTRIVGIDGTGGTGGTININIHTKDPISTFAAKYIVYRGGASIEDAMFLQNDIASHISMIYVNGCSIKNITCENAFNNGIEVQHALNSHIQNCIISNNTERGIYVSDSRKGGLYVVNNICLNNSLSSDQIDIEFTSSTRDNFVWANKGNLLDSGINNQPPQEQVNSISPLAFDDFVKSQKIDSPDGNSSLSTNPYGLSIDNNGFANEGFYFLPIEDLEYNSYGNYYFSGRDRQIVLSTNGGWRVYTDPMTGRKSLLSNSKGSKASITYYGVAVIALMKMGTGQSADVIKRVDGISSSVDLSASRGSLSDDFVPYLLYSGQTKEIHYAEVEKNDTSGDKALEIAGFFVQLSTGAANTIHVNKADVFISGLNYPHQEIPDLAIPTFSGNARTDCITASVGGAYQIVQGSIISSGGEQYAASVDVTHPLEEVSLRDKAELPELYTVSEFDYFDIDGAAFYQSNLNDSTLMVWSDLNGIYSGVTKDITTFTNPSLRLESATDAINMIVKGTGLDVEVGVYNGLDTEVIEVYVDGSYRGDLDVPSVTNDSEFVKLGVFANLEDRSHVVRLVSKTGNTSPCLYLQRLVVYRAKSPLVAANKLKVASYRNPITSGYIKHSLKENIIPTGTSWSTLAYDPERYDASNLSVAGGLGDYFEIHFYGTGIELFLEEYVGSSAASVLIDGSTPSSLGLTGTGDTIAAGSSSVKNQRAYWEGLTMAFHTIKITPTDIGETFRPNIYGVLGGVFNIKQQKNISPVGCDIQKLR